MNQKTQKLRELCKSMTGNITKVVNKKKLRTNVVNRENQLRRMTKYKVIQIHKTVKRQSGKTGINKQRKDQNNRRKADPNKALNIEKSRTTKTEDPKWKITGCYQALNEEIQIGIDQGRTEVITHDFKQIATEQISHEKFEILVNKTDEIINRVALSIEKMMNTVERTQQPNLPTPIPTTQQQTKKCVT
jgi:hypothetical protein